jgi:hypothetical protein
MARPLRKSAGVNGTDIQPYSRPASRQSARLSGTSTPNGGATMIEESALIKTLATHVAPSRSSPSVKVEIKVQPEVRVARTGRGSYPGV